MRRMRFITRIGLRSSLTLSLALLLSDVSPCLAQPVPSLGKWREHLSIAESLDDLNTINNPAFATLTIPDTGPTENVVAVAISAWAKPEKDAAFNYSASMQFNQNSASSARQNVFFGGALLQARRGGQIPNSLFSRLTAKAGYKRNGEKHTEGYETSAYVTLEKARPLSEDSSAIPVGAGRVEFTPKAGSEFAHVMAAEKPEDQGSVWRGVAALKLNYFPLPDRFRDRLIISLDVAYRYDLRTDFPADRHHPYAQISLAFPLDPHQIFSIGIDRVMGEDPTQDFFGPSFTRFALKVQLTKPQKRSMYFARQIQQRVF